jgi:crotonobetainyl-CoA:carnitine CoA-transferase CaiB-like acyl-CoA transferase
MTDDAYSSGPLAGLRAIELGSTVAGPFCARLLADFGADVIKVEQPEGDAVRSMGRRRDDQSLYGASILRGKRIVSIDLRSDEGRALARRLCERADIVVENFRPGTLEGWGLGYDDLDRPPPRMATALTDYIAGVYAAFGAVMAILDRTRTGKGQVVDAALYEGAFSFMEPHIPAFQQLGEVAKRAGSRLPGNTPNSLYPTRDGRHIVITAASDSVFARLAEAMGRSELVDDPRFATAVARADNEDACDAAVAAWSGSLDLAELETILEAAKVPAARIYSVADIFADPHYRAREMLVDVDDAQLGPVTVTGIVPKLSTTPGAVRWAGRAIGADTGDVLARELELSQDEIARLARAGVVTGAGLPTTGDE